LCAASLGDEMLRWMKRILSWSLQRISPHLHLWVVSAYQPVQAFFFLRKYPKVVNAGPRIVLLAGEDCPDKMGPYTALYDVYKVLRLHFEVDLRVYRIFRASWASPLHPGLLCREAARWPISLSNSTSRLS
jgi:hypothetical protein